MSPTAERVFYNQVQILGSKFKLQEQYLVANAIGNVLLLANPLRAYILWTVHAGDIAFLSTIPNALAGQGIRLTDTMSPYEMFWRTHGAFCQAAWYAGGLTNPFQVTVLTMDYHEDW